MTPKYSLNTKQLHIAAPIESHDPLCTTWHRQKVCVFYKNCVEFYTKKDSSEQRVYMVYTLLTTYGPRTHSTHLSPCTWPPRLSSTDDRASSAGRYACAWRSDRLAARSRRACSDRCWPCRRRDGRASSLQLSVTIRSRSRRCMTSPIAPRRGVLAWWCWSNLGNSVVISTFFGNGKSIRGDQSIVLLWLLICLF